MMWSYIYICVLCVCLCVWVYVLFAIKIVCVSSLILHTQLNICIVCLHFEKRYINMLGCDYYGYAYGKKSAGFDEGRNLIEPKINCKSPEGLGWMASLFFVMLVTTTAFVLLNVFIGLVSIAMEDSKVRQRKEAKLNEMLKMRAAQLGMSPEEVELYQVVFVELDINKNGKLDGYDLKALVRCLPMLHFATTFVDEPNHNANDEPINTEVGF
jgi:hypothetical protein